MNKWESVKLGEVCKIYQPKTITQKEITQSGKYKVFGANGVIGYYDKYNHDFEEVAVTCRGATCGTVNMTEAQSWITGNAMVITPLNSHISKKYLFHYLKNYNMERVITGSAQPQITKINIENILFIIPPLSIQQEIAERLDKMATLIEKSKAQLSHYDALAESLFIELFGDPITNEKGWQKKKLGEVCEFERGTVVTEKSSEKGVYPVISGGKKPAYYINQFNRDGETITVSGSGANAGFVQYWKEPIFVSDAFSIKSCNKGVLSIFTYRFLLGIQNKLYKLKRGAGVPHVYAKDVSELTIFLPPLSLQQAFAEMIENIEEQKAKIRAEIEQAEQGFQALLQESF